MKMVFRWFAQGHDSISLQYIRQIPGITGVAASLLEYPAGEVWPLEDILAVRGEVREHGLEMEVIESVNIHEDIKLGVPSRDRYIEAYIETIKNLSAAGVRCLCYNFMPVLDWARSDLHYVLPDSSDAFAYFHGEIENLNPANLKDTFDKQSDGFELPGWEPERLKEMSGLMDRYRDMTPEKYWGNVKYFLDAVIPYAERCDVKLAIHPDDPPWDIFGLPRLITSRENIRRFLDLNKSAYNGITFCTGSLGANRANEIPAMIREFGGEGRIHFTHVRNVKFLDGVDFLESAYPSEMGSLDMYEVVRALADVGYGGYIRPDHGRAVWGEKSRPGYGLFDRAMGAQYLLGLWEAVHKEDLRHADQKQKRGNSVF